MQQKLPVLKAKMGFVDILQILWNARETIAWNNAHRPWNIILCAVEEIQETSKKSRIWVSFNLLKAHFSPRYHALFRYLLHATPSLLTSECLRSAFRNKRISSTEETVSRWSSSSGCQNIVCNDNKRCLHKVRLSNSTESGALHTCAQ